MATINPNQPPPVALSSNLPPPPVWPLPPADWVVLPPVPPGWPTGPFSAMIPQTQLPPPSSPQLGGGSSQPWQQSQPRGRRQQRIEVQSQDSSE